MEVARFMTRDPLTVEPGDSLRAALDLMDEHRVRHLPVVRGERLVGVVSDRDLLEATGGSVPSDDARLDGTRVESVMQTQPAYVNPEDSVVTVSVEVALRAIGCLPVVDRERLVGIVTEFDLLELLTAASRDGALSGEVDPPVRTRMTPGVRTLEESDSLGDALAHRAELEIRHLPVLSEGRLVGMVSDRDLRRAKGQGLPDSSPIEDLMAHGVCSLPPDAPLSQAAALMTERKISAIPVLEEERLVGILTTSDVLDHCINTLRFAE